MLFLSVKNDQGKYHCFDILLNVYHIIALGFISVYLRLVAVNVK